VLALGVFGMLTNISFGQVIFSEDFEGTPDVTTDLPTGWTENGLSTDGVFNVGDNVEASAATYWIVDPHTLFAMTNDDACNCDKSVDIMVLPAQDFSAVTGSLTMTFQRNFIGSTETAGVLVSTDGGATWTAAAAITYGGSIDGTTGVATTTWDEVTVSLNAYAGMSNVLIAFGYNDDGNWGYGLAIDDIVIEQSAAAPEVTITDAVNFEYTIIPITEVMPYTLDLTVANNGSATAASVAVTANVYLNPDLTTPIATLPGTATNLAAGGSTVVSLGSWTPPGAGTFVLEYISTTAGDSDQTNDTVYQSITVSPVQYARDNGTPSQALGTGAGALEYGNLFTITNAVKLDSAWMFINPAAAVVGQNVKFIVTGVSGGIPDGTIIGQSADFTIAAAGGQLVRLPITDINTGSTLTLAPGQYFVAYSKATGGNHGVQSAASIFTPNSVYVRINGGAYTEISTLGFSVTPIIRAFVSPVCVLAATTSSTDAACTMSDGTASVSVTAGPSSPYTYLWDNAGETTSMISNVPAGDYDVTVTDFWGCQITETATVMNPNVPALAVGTQTDATCVGLSDGTLSVNVSGGAGSETYVWNPPVSTGTSATGLAAGVYDVTVTDALMCSSTLSVTVGETPEAIPAFTPLASICEGTTPPTLPGTDNNGITGSWNPGSFSGATGGVTETATFTPTAGQCATTGTLSLQVNAAGTIPTFTPLASTCVGAVAPTLPTTSNNTITGSWNAAPSTATQGTFTFTFTPDAGQCADPTTISFTVNPVTTTTFNSLTAVCQGATAPSLPTTSTNGVTGSWNAAPSTGTAGTFTFTFTPTAGQCASTATLSLTVNPNVTPSFTALAAVCQGAAAPTLPTSSTNGVTGTWNAAPSTATAGAFTFTFTPTAGQCASTATLSLQVKTTPTATAANNGPVCADIEALNLTVNTTAGASYSWSGPNGYSSASQNPSITNIPLSQGGSYTVTVTLNGCSSTATTVVQVDDCSGIAEESMIAYNVFPNPSAGNFTLTVDATDVTIAVTDLAGKAINVATTGANGVYGFDMSAQPNGTYLVRIITENGTALARIQVIR